MLLQMTISPRRMLKYGNNIKDKANNKGVLVATSVVSILVAANAALPTAWCI
jgi:hypothetical protein